MTTTRRTVTFALTLAATLAPTALIGSNPTVLFVKQASPYQTLADVIAAAKAKKPLNSASGSEMTAAQVGEFQKAEVAKWAQVIKAANIKLE